MSMVMHHCLKLCSTSSMSACIVVENTSIDTCIPRQFYCSIPPPKVVISFVHTYALLAKTVERCSHKKTSSLLLTTKIGKRISCHSGLWRNGLAHRSYWTTLQRLALEDIHHYGHQSHPRRSGSRPK